MMDTNGPLPAFVQDGRGGEPRSIGALQELWVVADAAIGSAGAATPPDIVQRPEFRLS